MSREQVHGVAGISARTRYQRSWPFAGSADRPPLLLRCHRDTLSRRVPLANVVGRRRGEVCGFVAVAEATT